MRITPQDSADMLLITTATKTEAEPIIRHFSLKSENTPAAPIYRSDSIILAVTGIGRELSASVTSYVFGKYENITCAVNFGIAGSLDESISIGECVLSNAFYSDKSERPIFPDILFQSNLRECAVITYDNTVSLAEARVSAVVDEEAYGFAVASRLFLQCDKVLSFKVVSDYATKAEAFDCGGIKRILEEAIPVFAEFTDKFIHSCSVSEAEYPNEVYSCTNEISRLLKLSFTQEHILASAIEDAYATYGTIPDVSQVLPPEKLCKKEVTPVFNKLVDCIKHNRCSVAVSEGKPQTAPERRFFTHTYVENSISEDSEVKRILSSLKSTSVIHVPHYKSVFNRAKQNVYLQSSTKNLILAKASGRLVYKGSDYCNSFGFEKFYYCSTVLGCAFGCEYCYLQGMYNSSFITAFVNTEDFFRQIEQEDDGTPMLVCCSYDSDIVALDGILHTVEKWLSFAQAHPNITLEIRTKSSSVAPFMRLPVKNVIIAYTVSPEGADRRFEFTAPPTRARLKAAENVARNGWRVRFCIEPILVPVVPCEDYISLADDIILLSESIGIEDIVLGEFRMNKPYFCTIAKRRKLSPVFHSTDISQENGEIFLEQAREFTSELEAYIVNHSEINVVKY